MEHDDVNVIAIAARVVGPALVTEIIDTFIAASFQPKERYVRRLNKVAALEERGS